MKLGLRCSSSIVALVLAVAAVPGFAQQAAAEASATSAEPSAADIVVTARRVEERLQDVPISITVFNQQQLNNRNVTNAQELALYTPSLSANSNFGAQNSTFAIRGFVQDTGTPPSVGVYFADVVAPRGPTQGTSAGDGAGPGFTYDLQNVQVLKGPQGTLQGRNTTGGAVLFVPQKPTGKFEGYIEGSYGNYDMKRVQAAVNVPLSDVARFRIALDHQTRDGYLKNDSGVGQRDFDDVDYTAVRASLVVDLTPNLENYIIGSYSLSDTHGDIQKIIGCNSTLSAANFLGLLTCAQLATEQAKGAGFYTVQNSGVTNPRSRLEQWQLINTTTWRASDAITLKNIISYAELRDYTSSALFGTNWFLAPNVSLPFVGVTSAPGEDTADQSTFTEELQLQGNAAGGKLTYQAGAYLEISDPLGESGNRNTTFLSCEDLSTFRCTSVLGATSNVNTKVGRTSFRDVGLYAQANYALTSRFKLTGGFRYTWDRQKASVQNITYLFPTPNTPVPFCTYAGTEPSCVVVPPISHSKAPTWLIDLDYKPTDNVLLYGKYSRGYRAGGVFPNSPSNYRVFDPEKVDAFEVGAKSSFRGPVSGTFNVAGFYNNFSNQQLQVGFNGVGGNAPTTGIVNAGKSRIYGVEVESTLTPFRGFTLDGAYTYLHTRIVSIAPLASTDPNYVIAEQITPGDRLELSPRHKLSVTASYALPLPEEVGKVTLASTFSYSSSQITAYAYETPAVLAAFGKNLGRLAPLKLLNLNLTWEQVAQLPFDLSLFATNVTNKHYYTYVPGLAGYGFESSAVGAPRMYGVRLRYRFR